MLIYLLIFKLSIFLQTISLNSIHGPTKEIEKIRIHREGTHILWASFLLLLLINAALYWGIDCKIPFYVVAVASIAVYLLMVNFFRCPIRLFGQDTEKIVVAPADGKSSSSKKWMKTNISMTAA